MNELFCEDKYLSEEYDRIFLEIQYLPEYYWCWKKNTG